MATLKKTRAKAPAKEKAKAARPTRVVPTGLKLPHDKQPPTSVTRDLFLVWRSPRFGVGNPTRFTNPVWAWLARSRLNAYQANKAFDGPSSFEVGPCFCVDRFGQSRTTLADGRVVAIGGEHEDYYDPDFFIYNDVIVESPSGELLVYGYPQTAFAPTDFHSATLVGDSIVIVGRVGYPAERSETTTPVYRLDTASYAIAGASASGRPPGWLHRHTAELAGDGRTVIVRGGQALVRVDDKLVFVENLDTWALDTEAWRWSRRTQNDHQQWSLARVDGKRNDLFDIGSLRWHLDGQSEYARGRLAEWRGKHGELPPFEAFDARYTPPLAHTKVETDEESWRETRVVVDGVVVRYVEGSGDVRVVVEGTLARRAVDAILEDARRKLEAIERVPYAAHCLVAPGRRDATDAEGLCDT